MTKVDISDSLSDEIKFLVACCQTDPSREDIETIASFIQHSTFNIQHSIDLSRRHGILPLVYKTLSRDELRMTNDELLTSFRAAYQAIAQRNMMMSAELIRIMRLLEENGIEAVAFKGPVLAQMAYGDITLRQYADLDILVRKEDIYRVDSLLRDQGYERLLELTEAQERVWIKFAHDMGLICRRRKIHFEMHWSLLDEDYPLQIDLEDFWRKRQAVPVNGNAIPAFSTENLLYYLCIHGSKHLWERIEWIKDIDLLLRGNEVDWRDILRRSKDTGFEKMVYLGLLLSTSLFDTPLPQNIQKHIAQYQQLNALSEFVFESWRMPKSTFAKTSAMLKLFPGPKERMIYLHKIILKPSFNEYWALDLPKGFYWGYYLLRPYLLLKKYLTKNS